MAAELPLPKRIFAHGWLLFENDKMSKSRGNIVRAEPIREVMGIEALRYFLFREIVFGQDGASATTHWSAATTPSWPTAWAIWPAAR